MHNNLLLLAIIFDKNNNSFQNLNFLSIFVFSQQAIVIVMVIVMIMIMVMAKVTEASFKRRVELILLMII